MYRLPNSGGKIGNHGFTTVLVLNAIATLRPLPPPQEKGLQAKGNNTTLALAAALLPQQQLSL